MFEYLTDQTFLRELDNMPIKIQYAKIILLDWNERPIEEIQGRITNGGSLSCNGSSAIRRTISFSMICTPDISNITNLDNLIALNKKMKVFIGYKNLVNGYEKYGDIIWFKCGMYIISDASVSSSTSGATISVKGSDKMVMLNGDVGGTLPASVTFHEKYELLDNGDIKISYPTMYEIIYETLIEYGHESANNIIISDLDVNAKMLVKYIGTSTAWLYRSDNGKEVDFKVQNEDPSTKNKKYYPYSYGQDIGYEKTAMTYPGELVLNAGETVVSLLDKIAKTLGNFEYFYDLDGKFIFQEKKNYLNNSYSPIITELNADNYIKKFSDNKYSYIFNNTEMVTSIQNSPKYSNIKNDFIVWGERHTSNGQIRKIRYHQQQIINLKY